MCKKAKLISCGLYLLLLLSLPVHISYGEEIMASEAMMQISVTQYNSLKETSKKLKSELVLQEERINLLENHSQTSTKELEALQTELQDCKTKLQQTENSLQKSEMAMQNAEGSLTNLNERLQTLNDKIKKLEHKTVIAKRQRDVWAGVSLASVLYLCIGKINS